MTWKAIARSVIGTSHQHHQLPCQDFAGYRILDDLIIGAIADGAGSAKYADLGAKLVVRTTLDYLAATETWLQQKRHISWQSLAEPPSEERLRGLFSKMVARIVTALQKQATLKGYSLNELSSTLLAFLATPHWIAAMQIGDGFMVVRSQAPRSNQPDYQLLFQPDKGEYANQTSFVTSTHAVAEMQVKVIAVDQPFITASTDALERVAIRLQDWTVFPPFFKPLEEYLQETPQPEQDDAYLMQFLESERLNQRTDDDKTLLLCSSTLSR